MANSLNIFHQFQVAIQDCDENIDFTSNDSVTSLLNSSSYTSRFNGKKFKPSEKIGQNLTEMISTTTMGFNLMLNKKSLRAMKLCNVNFIVGDNYNRAVIMTNHLKDYIDSFYNKVWINDNNTVYKHHFKPQPFVDDINEPDLIEINNLINQVLKSVEKLYKKHTDSENDNESDKLLKCLIIQPLSSDLEDCDLATINNRLENVLKSSIGHHILRCCHPLLEQYALLVQFFITQQTMVYRALSKFNYLLSTLFTDLASNVSYYSCIQFIFRKLINFLL